MKNPNKTRRQQRGTVLVTVLMMFAIATFLAAEMAYRQRLDVRRTSAMLMSDQAREYLRAAENLSMLALKDDFKADKKNGGKFVDGLGEEWALKRPPFPVEGGLIQGEIIDAQGKFNINDLINPESGDAKGAKAEIAKTRFKKLCDGLGIPKEGSSEDLYQKIVDWLDKGQDETCCEGREDSAYLSAKRPYRAGNYYIVDVTELRSIEGMDLETYNALEPFITALPPATRLNLNTAKNEVLEAFGVNDYSILLGQRERNPIDENEISKYLPKLPDNPGGAPPTSTIKAEDLKAMFSANSSYFELRAKATIGDRTLYSRSLIYRPADAGNGKSDKLEVIYRAYVDPLQQPMTPVTNNNNQSE